MKRLLRHEASVNWLTPWDFRTSRSEPAILYAVGLQSAARSLISWFFASGTKLAVAAKTGTVRGHIVTQNLALCLRK
jgi:hypothetical protein